MKCQLLGKWLNQSAAPSNPTIKFVQILSTRCIPNYPDSNLPTVLLYRLGALQKRVLGADAHKVQELIDQIIEIEKGDLNLNGNYQHHDHDRDKDIFFN